MRILLILLIASSCLFAQNYAADSLIVRAVLDSNGWTAFSVSDVSQAQDYRIVSLDLKGYWFNRYQYISPGVYTKIPYFLAIQKLPSFIASLTELQTLNLNGNQLTSLPNEIVNLANLRNLYLNNTHLYPLDTSAAYYGDTAVFRAFSREGKISNFVVRPDNYMTNCLKTLPDSMGKLTNLIALHLNNTMLSNLPSTLGNISGLQELLLNANSFSEFPAIIPGFTNLRKLCLGNNYIPAVPSTINNLAQLDSLDLKNNVLTSIPITIGDLDSLRYLYLNNNQLSSLPDAIGNLSKLQLLSLTQNVLIALPATIGGLTNLQYLYVDYNQLAEIPASIGACTQIRRLYAAYNRLTGIPDGIGNLGYLFDAQFQFNRIESVPAAIGTMGNHVTYHNPIWLHLNHNLLTTVPGTIGNIRELYALKLHNNRLTSVPGAIAKPSSLRILELQHNELTSLPDSLAIRTYYFYFKVFNNKLTSLPNFSHNGFYELYAYNNQITGLPDSFCNLSSLKYAYLSRNQIASLPDSFGTLTALSWFKIDSNQLTALPGSITRRPLNSAISSFAQNKLCSVPSDIGTWLDARDPDWASTQDCGGVTGMENNSDQKPVFSLAKNMPNPFNPSTAISYTLPSACHVILEIYAVNGALAATLFNGNAMAGTHTAVWNADGMSSGIYYYKLSAGKFTATKKCLLVK